MLDKLLNVSAVAIHIADRRVEILGFTQHQIREYIEKALDGNSTHIQKLVQHLEDHPVYRRLLLCTSTCSNYWCTYS